jgi:hypothetical protein
VATGNVKYAWYRQARGPTGTWHWVGIPTDYDAGSNTLNSTLGGQLARGLAANAFEPSADTLHILRSDGTFTNYYLDGSRQWVGSISGRAEPVVVPAGAGVLIHRRTGSVLTTNCVFAGPCRTNGYVVPINATWNLVSWPYDAPSHNWGFITSGHGGTQPSDSDEVWFMGRASNNHAWLGSDGIWRLAGSGLNATNAIQLEAGEGFYYRNRYPATTWTPVNPNP